MRVTRHSCPECGDSQTNRTNLVVAHDGCHLSYHSHKRSRTVEQRAKTSATLRGRPRTKEARVSIGAASKRSWDERRSKRYPCPNGCGRMLADTWVKRHAKACNNQGEIQ